MYVGCSDRKSLRVRWWSLLLCGSVWCIAGPARGQTGEHPASRPAPLATSVSGLSSDFCTPLTQPGTDRIELTLPNRTSPISIWTYRPPGYAPGQRPPLLICLHGTDDTALDMIEFWRERRMRVPAVLVAPQGMGKGWTSDDVATIRATFDYTANCIWHDPHRILLVGFSAGGAMTFQMLYVERVPVTAVAALANYVPPRLTVEDVRGQRHVPVLYAVGMADINHELMRSGLDFLRSAGANVEVYRPPIGHTLDPGVGQATVDWFFDRCEKQTEAAIKAAIRPSPIAPAAARLEQIISQPNWHPQAQVERAEQALVELEKPGRVQLRSAESLAAQGKAGQAAELYEEIEATYGLARLAVEARHRRERLEAAPVAGQQIRLYRASKRADRAMAEYARAQKLVSQRQLGEAAALCRRIVDVYADTPAAVRAEHLLTLLDGRTSP